MRSITTAKSKQRKGGSGLAASAALLWFGSVFVPTWAGAQVESGGALVAELFQPSAWPASMPPRSISVSAIPVAIDLGGLSQLAEGDRIEFNAGTSRLAAVVERVEIRSDDSWSRRARIESDPDGVLLLACEGEALAGLVQAPLHGGVYRIQFVGSGVHEFTPVESMSTADCATEGPGTAPDVGPEEFEKRVESRGSCPAPTPNGDVIIYYTASARAEAGGVDAMNAECQLAVDTANLTYVDSSVTNRLTLLFRSEVSYTEAGNVETDRNRLTGTSDGHMDFVHADRNYLGADYVSLFVRASDADACGIAYCTPSGAALGFCVVNWTCASSNFSFAHEVGHLQGCAHNKEDAGSGCNHNCYSFGHRFTGDSMTGWRTLMSYDTESGDFSRIGRWSNPDIAFDGQPCGVWTGDCDDDNRFNAATVSNTALDREAWRSPLFEVWVERFASGSPTGTYQHPYSTVEAGVAAVFGGTGALVQPLLTIKSGSYPGAVVLSKPMRIAACGLVVIGS